MRAIIRPRVRNIERYYLYIYIAINNVNGKIYVGQTQWSIEYRKNKHFQEAKCERNGKRKMVYFHNAILKYGENAFDFYEIDSAETHEELDEKEAFWIEVLETTNKTIGYNLDSGGSHCVRHPSTIEKLRSSTQFLHDTNPYYRTSSLRGLKAGTEKWKSICESRRIEFVCPVCNKHVKLPRHIAENKTYCSRECAFIGENDKILEHLKLAAKVNADRKLMQNEEISKTIYSWTQDNRDLVINCPFNKISTTLKDLQCAVETKHGVKDWRTIGEAVGCRYKKEFLLHLKNYLDENICCSSPN